MRKLLLAAACAFVLPTSSFAADMPVKAPVYRAAPAPYDPWTGFYTGGSIGARWSDVDWTSVSLTGGTPITGGPNNPASFDRTSFRIGGYIGYNWKIAPA